MKTRFRVLLVTAGAALTALALTASAAQATPPASPYEDFAGCPSPAETQSVAYCFKYTFTGGHFQLGKKEVPVTNPITLRGGALKTTGDYIANSEGGIVPVRQTVTGGLVGLTGLEWLDEILSKQEQLKVYAVVELAGNPGTLETLPLTLPIKIHLENAVLGSGCYVGSNEHPIQLSLITGTTNPPAPNQPITGVESGEFTPEAARPAVLTSDNGIFVDNSFAVPGASGCQLNIGSRHIPIDELVNKAAGLPAAAGTNEAKLNFNFAFVAPPSLLYP